MRNHIKKVFLLILSIQLLFGLLAQSQYTYAQNNFIAIKKDMSGDSVKKLQNNLKSLGYYDGKVTGYFGDATLQAVKRFQRSNNLLGDGIVGLQTYQKINSLVKKVRTKSTTIIIDPGHGGIDPGAMLKGVVEKEVNLDVAKRLQSYLKSEGYRTVMTRTTDISLYPKSKIKGTTQERDLNARVQLIHKSKPKLFVSIHVNSHPENPGTSGSIVFYNHRVKGSKELAASIQKELNSIRANGKSREKNSIQRKDFYILKNSSVPGVLVETAFITNTGERKLISQKDFRDKLALAVKDGIKRSGLLN